MTQKISNQDWQTLCGDMELVAGDLRDHLREQMQLTRNYSRLANAVMDTARFLRYGKQEDALEVCLQALGDVGQTGYANDDDTPEWCAVFLGEEDDE